jgi:L-fuconolactonase
MEFPIVDAHQHVWNPALAEYDWLGEHLKPINRAFEFEELSPELRRLGIQHTIQVQSADNSEDTEIMLASARKHPEVLGVVGYVPLDNPSKANSIMELWISEPKLVGVRNLIHNKKDPFWLLKPEVIEGLATVSAAGYTFDVVAETSEHLMCVSKLSETNEKLRMVIDHLGKPPIGAGSDREWRSRIRDAAQNPNVYAKVSGLYSASGRLDGWSTDLIEPYFDFALEVFGANRLMYGGDWPVSILAGGYTAIWNGLVPLFQKLSERDRKAILAGTALEFYGIEMSTQ